MVAVPFDKNLMTQPTTDVRFLLSMERGEVREAMGWSFVARLERLTNELLAKSDCPEVFYIVYSAKWDPKSRKIKELWQVDDSKPKNHMLGQVIYEVHKSGYAEYWALPLDIPVPDEEYSDEMVMENYDNASKLVLSDQMFVK